LDATKIKAEIYETKFWPKYSRDTVRSKGRGHASSSGGSESVNTTATDIFSSGEFFSSPDWAGAPITSGQSSTHGGGSSSGFSSGSSWSERERIRVSSRRADFHSRAVLRRFPACSTFITKSN
jgi:hypothetical protein